VRKGVNVFIKMNEGLTTSFFFLQLARVYFKHYFQTQHIEDHLIDVYFKTSTAFY